MKKVTKIFIFIIIQLAILFVLFIYFVWTAYTRFAGKLILTSMIILIATFLFAELFIDKKRN